jgi:hypothetical protein
VIQCWGENSVLAPCLASSPIGLGPAFLLAHIFAVVAVRSSQGLGRRCGSTGFARRLGQYRHRAFAWGRFTDPASGGLGCGTRASEIGIRMNALIVHRRARPEAGMPALTRLPHGRIPRDETPVSSRAFGRNSVSGGAGCLRVGDVAGGARVQFRTRGHPLHAKQSFAPQCMTKREFRHEDFCKWQPLRRCVHPSIHSESDSRTSENHRVVRRRHSLPECSPVAAASRVRSSRWCNPSQKCRDLTNCRRKTLRMRSESPETPAPSWEFVDAPGPRQETRRLAKNELSALSRLPPAEDSLLVLPLRPDPIADLLR